MDKTYAYQMVVKNGDESMVESAKQHQLNKQKQGG